MKRLLYFVLPFVPVSVLADVQLIAAEVGTTSYFSQCFPIYSLANPEVPLTGITGSTTSFKIEMQADNASADTEFETTADIETIASIGTYVSPTANTDIRFGECGSSGHYQIQVHNDHMNQSGARMLTFTFGDGGSTMLTQTAYLNQDVATLADMVAAFFQGFIDTDLETNVDYRCALRAMLSVAAGDYADSSTTRTYDAPDGTTPRVVGTYSEDGSTRDVSSLGC